MKLADLDLARIHLALVSVHELDEPIRLRGIGEITVHRACRPWDVDAVVRLVTYRPWSSQYFGSVSELVERLERL